MVQEMATLARELEIFPACKRIGTEGDCWLVASATTPGAWYNVQRLNGWTCDCQAGRSGRHVGRCIHAKLMAIIRNVALTADEKREQIDQDCAAGLRRAEQTMKRVQAEQGAAAIEQAEEIIAESVEPALAAPAAPAEAEPGSLLAHDAQNAVVLHELAQDALPDRQELLERVATLRWNVEAMRAQLAQVERERDELRAQLADAEAWARAVARDAAKMEREREDARLPRQIEDARLWRAAGEALSQRGQERAEISLIIIRGGR